jgi:hypothetical protein
MSVTPSYCSFISEIVFHCQSYWFMAYMVIQDILYLEKICYNLFNT